jgi:hypothetical protein
MSYSALQIGFGLIYLDLGVPAAQYFANFTQNSTFVSL